MGGGRLRGGVLGLWEGLCPLPRKNEFSLENGGYFGAF